MAECAICCEPFYQAGINKRRSTNEQISKYHIQRTCHNCQVNCGQSCFYEYLTDITTEPHCPFCESIFTTKHLYYMFPKKYVDNDIRDTRLKEYIKRERNALSTTMKFAKIILEADKEYKEASADIISLREELNNGILSSKSRENLIPQITSIKDKLLAAQSKSIRLNSDNNHTYVYPCPVHQCRGFINSNTMACGVCQTEVCPSCYEQTSQNHECNPDVVKNVDEMISNTKACPGCNVRIYKAFGCNHMFCTQCQKAFDWTTLKEIKRGFHNPHQVEQQQQRQQQRQQQQQHQDRRTALTYARFNEIQDTLERAARFGRMDGKSVPQFIKNIVNRAWFETYTIETEEHVVEILNNNLLKTRIEYLTGYIDDATFEQTIKKQISQSEFIIEQLQVLRQFEQCIIDETIDTIIEIENRNTTFETFEAKVASLIEWANTTLYDIHERWVSKRRKIPYIDEDWGNLENRPTNLSRKRGLFEKKQTTVSIFPQILITNGNHCDSYPHMKNGVQEVINESRDVERRLRGVI